VRGTTVLPLPGLACSGTNNLNNQYLQVPSSADSGNPQNIIGLRFTTVAVPRNATIVRAYLQAEVGQAGDVDGPMALSVVGELASDTTAANGDFNNNNRTPCSRLSSATNLVPTISGAVAPVGWQRDTLPAVDDQIRSPDLAALLQPMVNHSSWGFSSGTATLLMYKAAGSTNAWLGFSSYNRGAARAPKLVVEYYTGTASTATVTSAL